MTRRRKPETAIHCTLVQHLQVRGEPDVIWWHTPNGGYRNTAEAALLKAMGVKAGVPDLILFRAGRLYCLEIKAQGGRASPEQIAFIGALDNAGAHTALVTGLDACLATLESWGLLKPDRTVKDVLRASLQRLEARQ